MPRTRVLPETLTVPQPVKKLHVIYETREIHYRIHKGPSFVSFLRQINPVPSFPSNFLKIHFNIIIPFMPRSSTWSLSLRYPYRKPVCTSLIPHSWDIQHKFLPQLTIQNPIKKSSFKTSGKNRRRNMKSHTEAESGCWWSAKFMNFIQRKKYKFRYVSACALSEPIILQIRAVVKVHNGAPLVTHVTRKLYF